MLRKIWLVYDPARSFDCLMEGPEQIEWTIHCKATIGDHVVFYLRSPVSAIVASGRVLTEPKQEEWAREWSRVMPYCATIEITTVYDPPILYREMSDDSELYQSWGLIRAQMQSLSGPQLVPHQIAQRLIDKQGLCVD